MSSSPPSRGAIGETRSAVATAKERDGESTNVTFAWPLFVPPSTRLEAVAPNGTGLPGSTKPWTIGAIQPFGISPGRQGTTRWSRARVSAT